jgi:hypothetical protein
MSFARASGATPSPLSEAAETQPLPCLIDSVRWMDRPSEKALAFASAVFSRGRWPWRSQPASRSRNSEEELDRYDVRGLKNPRGYSGAALTFRVHGRMIVADEALRIAVVLELSPAAWRAISAETREGSKQLRADWRLERLPVAYGLTDPSTRGWACSSGGAAATTKAPPVCETVTRMTADRC